MKIKNGKIKEATESELFDYYLSRGFDDIMSFTDYMKRCESLGTIITEKEENMRPKKKLPKYDDIIFFKFEDAKRVRSVIMDILSHAKEKDPENKHFVSVSDLKNNLSQTRLDQMIVDGSKPGDQVVEDNRKYGWTKRPGIYEVENGNPSAGYIFEEPVLLTQCSKYA